MKRPIFFLLFLFTCFFAPLNLSMGADVVYLDDYSPEEIGHFSVECAYFPIEPVRASVVNDSAYLDYTVCSRVDRTYPINGYSRGFPWGIIGSNYETRVPSDSLYMVVRVPLNNPTQYLRILWSDGITRYYDVSYTYEIYLSNGELVSKCEFWFSDDRYNYYLAYSPQNSWTSFYARFFFPLTERYIPPTPTPIPSDSDIYTITYIYSDPYTGDDLFPNEDFTFTYDFDPFANGSFELSVDGFLFPEFFPVYGERVIDLSVYYKDINHLIIYPSSNYKNSNHRFFVEIPLLRNITDYRSNQFSFDDFDFTQFGSEFFNNIKLLINLSWSSYWFLWLIPVVGLIVLFVYKN